MAPVRALERIHLARGTALAIGLTFAKKGGDLPESLRSELAEAMLDG